MNWIDSIIQNSEVVTPLHQRELDLVNQMVDIAFDSDFINPCDRGLFLAAFYDMAIAAAYYSCITSSGWLYCRNGGSPKLLLPFVNCCPIDAMQGSFVFHKSSKPTSAIIGTATSRVLLLFFQSIFKKTGRQIEVYKATEPADAIFLDRGSKKAFFAEIKASPLVTLPIAMECEVITDLDEDGRSFEPEHCPTINAFLTSKNLQLMMPTRQGSDWVIDYFSIGKKCSKEDYGFSYLGLSNLLKDESFVKQYLSFWFKAYQLYCTKDSTDNLFWFTNACGKPANLPEAWADGKSTCISDAKTSVGMDRTDDIKKGIYQVLKLGSEGKVVISSWDYKVGILSNIHPARHFHEYLKPIKDIVWATTTQTDISVAGDLDSNTPVFNLFDGIVTFTESYIRDPWILNNLFDFKR